MNKMLKHKKVLLLEPNYSNKYPPIGLMKIATYHRNLGDWDVIFYKGDLNEFVIDRISDRCITDLNEVDDSINWNLKKSIVKKCIKYRRHAFEEEMEFDKSEFHLLLFGVLKNYENFYWKKQWQAEPEWDRVFVTTLFTFYWDITIETIEFAKLLVKDKKNLMVGGVLASIQPDEIEKATGIKPFVGVLNQPGILDKNDKQIIDELPLDYSILDEIDYKYPMSNAYYGYTTRGCIRKCAFCAVRTMEPDYVSYIPLKERVEGIRNRFGEQKDLLLMDNNVLASENFPEIIQDIIDCGFAKGSKYIRPNEFNVAFGNLFCGINDRAYIRKLHFIINELYHKISNKEESFEFYKILEKYNLIQLETVTKENLMKAYEELQPYNDKHFKTSPTARYVDFNQGLDARLFNAANVKLLSSISIRPLRIAFDDIKTRQEYEKAVRLSASAGIKDFSNYILYNFHDQPIDLYRRLLINVEMCDELSVNIYSFPMKYHPLRKEADGTDYSHNRDYIGEKWNRKYIRAVQAILNSTKGKVGKGQSFFKEAFGSTEEEYMELLEMPETFILYRFFFKWLDESHGMGTNHWRSCWNECMSTLSSVEFDELRSIIHTNQFTEDVISSVKSEIGRKLLGFYVNFRSDIITPGTQLYEYKKEYDQNSTYKLRRRK